MLATLRTPRFSLPSSESGALSASVSGAALRGLYGVPVAARERLRDFAEDLVSTLHPKQRLVLDSPATEILFGGAAGPGKSHLIRVAAIVWSIRIPGLLSYLFRREYGDLWKNHMEGPHGFPELLAPLVNEGLAKINNSEKWISIGRSRIFLCHCQHEKDRFGYQGAEIHLLLPDELSQFTDAIYRYLRGRVRIVGLALPAEYRSLFPRVIAGSNPGGVGHNFVKETFVSPRPATEMWQTLPAEGAFLRQFVPARLEDNPSMTGDDPGYGDRLMGIGGLSLVRAMREGDWDIVDGGAFDDLWRADHHVVEPFSIPASWYIDRSFDWGSAHPFSVGWWAETDGTEATLGDGRKRSWPRGTLFRIAEWYGWNGRPNEGAKMTAADIGRRLLKIEEASPWRGRVRPGAADSSIFDVEEGESIASKMEGVGVRWEHGDKTPGSRRNGMELFRDRLKAGLPHCRCGHLMELHGGGACRSEKCACVAPEGVPMEGKGIFVFSTCVHAIRTLPVLPRAPGGLDVNTEAEDHVWDETRYRLLAVRHEVASLPLKI